MIKQSCQACKFESKHGTEEVPHPVDRRIHSCVEFLQAETAAHQERKRQTFAPIAKETHDTLVSDYLDERDALAKSIPMILHCPDCKGRHIDEGWFAEKPHHTHACQVCGLVWRPAIVNTIGVWFLPGFKNETYDLGDSLGPLPPDVDPHAMTVDQIAARLNIIQPGSVSITGPISTAWAKPPTIPCCSAPDCNECLGENRCLEARQKDQPK